MARSNASGLNLALRDAYYKKPMGLVQGVQANAVPKEWEWTYDDNPVSRLVAGFSKPQVHREVKAQLPTGKFYYENIGKIAPQSLTAQPLQCSVLLSWQTADDNPVDYFVVKRRDIAHAANDWRVIASHIVEMSYEDKTTSPVHDYEYQVLSANDCEGLSFDSTRVVTGACIQTGTVEEYPNSAFVAVIMPDELPFTVTDGDMLASFVDGECRGIYERNEELYSGWRGENFFRDGETTAQLRYYSAEKQGVYTIETPVDLTQTMQNVYIKF